MPALLLSNHMEKGQALVRALLFGKLEGLDEEVVFLFARTGLVHLFSASGFHLWAARKVADTLAEIILPFVKNTRARAGVQFGSRVLLMIFFGNATDWSSPMVRAFVFASLSAGGKLLELQASRHWLFLLSLVVSAVLGKGSTLSFLLSTCGMAGILYVQPRKFWALALGPWLFTLPITLYFFGLFPLLAPLWNLSFGMAISWLVLPAAILALLGKQLGLPVEWLEDASAWLMLHLTALLESASSDVGLAFWVRPLPWLFLVAALLSAIFLWKGRSHKAAVALAAAAILLAKIFPEPALAMLDVGQGDGVLLRTPSGLILSDVGPPGWQGATAPICRSLEAQGIGNIDQVLLSHFDLDHRGGLDSLLARHAVRGALWFREEDLTAKHSDLVLSAAERAGLPIRFLSHEQPPPGLECWLAPFPEGNDSSPLCRARLDGAGTVLLTGDMSEKAETWFVENLQVFPRADILKVAHHGSGSSSSAAFLAASGIRSALISVGVKNRYHHPAPEALDRLADKNIRVRRTDTEGTVNIYPWRKIISYFSLGFITEESTRPVAAGSRENPGIPAFARRE